MTQPDLLTRRAAVISADGLYRYELERVWDEQRPLVFFIGLNPSTADETEDDPTIRRMCGFARSWDAGGILVGNLFAYRATDPRELANASDPIGPDNDEHLLELAGREGVAWHVAAWGAHPAVLQRADDVFGLLLAWPLHCLGRTRSGSPAHPLYLPATAELERL